MPKNRNPLDDLFFDDKHKVMLVDTATWKKLVEVLKSHHSTIEYLVQRNNEREDKAGLGAKK